MPVQELPREDIRRELRQMIESHKAEMLARFSQLKEEMAEQRATLPEGETANFTEMEAGIDAKLEGIDELYDQFFAFVDNA